jgi:hypothetical protein
MLHWKLRLVCLLAVAVTLSAFAGYGAWIFGWIWD